MHETPNAKCKFNFAVRVTDYQQNENFICAMRGELVKFIRTNEKEGNCYFYFIYS